MIKREDLNNTLYRVIYRRLIKKGYNLNKKKGYYEKKVILKSKEKKRWK